MAKSRRIRWLTTEEVIRQQRIKVHRAHEPRPTEDKALARIHQKKEIPNGC
jgi:hypothetical protein